MLRLALAEVGLDRGGFWRCTDSEADCYSDWTPSIITSPIASQGQNATVMDAFRYAGPVYALVDVSGNEGPDIRFSVDGIAPNCNSAQISGLGWTHCAFSYEGSTAAQVARRVSYGGKQRILLYATPTDGAKTEGWQLSADPSPIPETSILPLCSNLQAWVCGPGSVLQISAGLNLREALSSIRDPRKVPFRETLGPLQPGPVLRMNIVLSQRPSPAKLSDLRQRLCGAVWNLTSPNNVDRCEWQLWVELADGANGEVWDDSTRRWIPSNRENYQASVATCTVSVTALMESNSDASRARHLLNREVNSAAFASTFKIASMKNVTLSGDSGSRTGNKQYFAHVTAPSPAAKRDQDSSLGCASHYECKDGLFCSTYAMQSWKMKTWAACAPCETCFSELYTVEKSCPADRCGPRAGTYPKCWDAQKLLASYDCQSSHKLNLSLVPGLDTAPDPSATLGAVQPTTRRARYLTPFNRVVGALIIRQKRLQNQPERAKGSYAVCSIRNDSLGQYCSTADPSRGLLCRGQLPDSTVYGTDPVFTTASSLYDGIQNPLDYYNRSEISTQNPYGFFPHKYNHKTGGTKTTTLVAAEADNFLVYLDERISSIHAQNIITYLNDGGFIDQQTSEVSVEINTLNADSGLFCKTIITFTWQVFKPFLIFFLNL